MQVVIDTAAVSTGLAVLDARMRQGDLLATTAHPQACIVAERLDFAADGGVAAVTGEFTLRGQGRPLRLVAQRFRCYLNPLLRREVCDGDFDADLQRSDFGMSFGQPFVTDTVRLKIAVQAIRQTP